MRFLTYFLLALFSIFCSSTYYAMEKSKILLSDRKHAFNASIQKPHPSFSCSASFRRSIKKWGHISAISFFKIIRFCMCGTYHPNNISPDNDAPYNVRTFEPIIYGWTTKNIETLKRLNNS